MASPISTWASPSIVGYYPPLFVPMVHQHSQKTIHMVVPAGAGAWSMWFGIRWRRRSNRTHGLGSRGKAWERTCEDQGALCTFRCCELSQHHAWCSAMWTIQIRWGKGMQFGWTRSWCWKLIQRQLLNSKAVSATGSQGIIRISRKRGEGGGRRWPKRWQSTSRRVRVSNGRPRAGSWRCCMQNWSVKGREYHLYL